MISPTKKIYISESKVSSLENTGFVSGRGVFAGEDIKKGEVIEVAPILVLEFTEFIDSKWNLLFEYYFWMDHYVVLALGYGSLYNHSKDPNCKYKINRAKKSIQFTALKNIKKDSEIYFDYSATSSTKTPLWFQREKHIPS